MRRLAPLVLAVSIALVAACEPGAVPLEPAPVPDHPGMAIEVSHVFDGDSFEAKVGGIKEEVRLIGINAPEGDECHGDRSRRALVDLLSTDVISLEPDMHEENSKDRYGRLLRYVYADGVLVNDRLLENGHATALQSDHQRNDAFADAAATAADAGTGMWAPDACGPPPPDGIEIIAVEYNPPGPDDENLNGESVTIENTGSETIDLSGWTLRDESSQNRFTLDGVELWPETRVVVHSGCGTDASSPRLQSLHWCADTPVWSNGGDTVILQDRQGNVVDWYLYTDDR